MPLTALPWGFTLNNPWLGAVSPLQRVAPSSKPQVATRQRPVRLGMM